MSLIDQDLLLALRLEAEDYGITDEGTLNKLEQEFIEGKITNVGDFMAHQPINQPANPFRSNRFSDLIRRMNDVSSRLNISNTGNVDDELNDIDDELNGMFENMTSRVQRPNNMNYSYGNFDSELLNSSMSYAGFNSFMSPSGQFYIQTPMMSNNVMPPNLHGGQIASIFSGPNPFANIFSGFDQMMQNMNEPVTVTLTESALDGLKDMTYDELKSQLPNLDADENCSICFDKLSNESDKHKYNKLPCDHSFHSDCIKEYLKNYNYHCPICKAECGEHKAHID